MDVRARHAALAHHLLAQLTADQRDAARRPSDDAERRQWTYLPGRRAGVALADLGREGAAAALRLLAGGLSPHAFAQAATIMALEDVLDAGAAPEPGRARRHRGDYWVAIFGDPADDAWGWRIGGHHLSVRVQFAGDATPRCTPLFFGANPARTAFGGHPVVEPLAPEEAVAFELLDRLDADERSRAVIADDPPADLVTRDATTVASSPEPPGLPVEAMSQDAQDLARQLVEVHLGRLPRWALRPPAEQLSFAWAGGAEPGAPHYYRLRGGRFLVELDNTQDDANHVHSVVRDLEADFADDVLATHLRHDHGR